MTIYNSLSSLIVDTYSLCFDSYTACLQKLKFTSQTLIFNKIAIIIEMKHGSYITWSSVAIVIQLFKSIIWKNLLMRDVHTKNNIWQKLKSSHSHIFDWYFFHQCMVSHVLKISSANKIDIFIFFEKKSMTTNTLWSYLWQKIHLVHSWIQLPRSECYPLCRKACILWLDCGWGPPTACTCRAAPTRTVTFLGSNLSGGNTCSTISHFLIT